MALPTTCDTFKTSVELPIDGIDITFIESTTATGEIHVLFWNDPKWLINDKQKQAVVKFQEITQCDAFVLRCGVFIFDFFWHAPPGAFPGERAMGCTISPVSGFIERIKGYFALFKSNVEDAQPMDFQLYGIGMDESYHRLDYLKSELEKFELIKSVSCYSYGCRQHGYKTSTISTGEIVASSSGWSGSSSVGNSIDIYYFLNMTDQGKRMFYIKGNGSDNKGNDHIITM